MALIKCNECGKEISDQAEMCPNCGCPVSAKPKKKEHKILKGVICAITLILIPIAFIGVILMWVWKIPKSKVLRVVLTIIFSFLFIVNFFSSGSDTPSTNSSNVLPKEEYIKECLTDVSYKDVLRNPENYVGKKICIELKVSVVKSKTATNPRYYFAHSKTKDYDSWYGDMYGVFDYTDGSVKVLEDDIIRVYGEISQPRETVSKITNSEEIFCIDMRYVEIIEE